MRWPCRRVRRIDWYVCCGERSTGNRCRARRSRHCDGSGRMRQTERSVMPKKLSQKKAKEILKHGKVHGHTLTPKQRGLMGARASGKPVRRGR